MFRVVREERHAVEFSVKGLTLLGVFHRPVERSCAPAVVLLHGFAGSKVGPKRLYVETAEKLVAAGIAVLRFDMRGCGDSEGQFQDLSITTHLEDAIAAYDWLQGRSEVVPHRIGVWGVSLGGAIASLLSQERRLRSLALWAPVASGSLWQMDWERAYPSEKIEGHIRCGGQTAGSAFTQEFIAMEAHRATAGRMAPPMLHIHGGIDSVVFPHHADLYRRSRGDLGVESHFLHLPSADHNFSAPADRERAIHATVGWFQKTL